MIKNEKPKQKKWQIIAEDRNGNKTYFYKEEGDITFSIYEITKYANLFKMKSIKINFGNGEANNND